VYNKQKGVICDAAQNINCVVSLNVDLNTAANHGITGPINFWLSDPLAAFFMKRLMGI
jgi:hypothetical protein